MSTLMLGWLLVSAGAGAALGASIDKAPVAERIFAGVGLACLMAGGGILLGRLWVWSGTVL